MRLFEDGSGRIGATMVLLPFLWKEVGEKQIELAMVNPDSGELIEERMQFVLTDRLKEHPNEKRSVPMLQAVGKDLVYFKVSTDTK